MLHNIKASFAPVQKHQDTTKLTSILRSFCVAHGRSALGLQSLLNLRLPCVRIQALQKAAPHPQGALDRLDLALVGAEQGGGQAHGWRLAAARKLHGGRHVVLVLPQAHRRQRLVVVHHLLDRLPGLLHVMLDLCQRPAAPNANISVMAAVSWLLYTAFALQACPSFGLSHKCDAPLAQGEAQLKSQIPSCMCL